MGLLVRVCRVDHEDGTAHLYVSFHDGAAGTVFRGDYESPALADANMAILALILKNLGVKPGAIEFDFVLAK